MYEVRNGVFVIWIKSVGLAFTDLKLGITSQRLG